MKRLRVRDRVMTSRDACTSGSSRVITVASLQQLKLEALILAPAECEVRSVIKSLNAYHNAHRNSSYPVPGLWPYTARRSTHLLLQFGWEVFSLHPPYSPDLAPNDFHLVLSASEFLEWQRCGDECHSGPNPRQQTSATQGTKDGPTMCQISQFWRWIRCAIAQHLLYLFQQIVPLNWVLFLKTAPGKPTLWTRYL